MDLKSLALQVLNGKPSRKPEGNNDEKSRKLLPSGNDKKFPVSDSQKTSEKDTPVSSQNWINDNRNSLKDAGFSYGDLYNQNLPIGIAKLLIWDKPGLSVELRENTIFFTWREFTGQKIIQTCRPK